MSNPSSTIGIVADIGGTNTRVALTRGAVVQEDSIRRYRNADEPGIVQVLTRYLADTDSHVHAACVAMAGPVSNGVGTLTNLDWRVDRNEIAAALGVRTVSVLNDLQAQGHSLNHIGPEHLDTLRVGAPSGDHAARLVLNVGTGLNAALVYRTDFQTLVPPSESGHIHLTVQDEEDLRLASFLRRAHGFAGAEEALSGRGLVNLYAFACHEAGQLIPDITGADVFAAAQTGDAVASRAVGLFVRMMGRWASDLALVQIPMGGIYLFGGVVRGAAPFFATHGFEEAFRDKGRFSDFLTPFPVHVVTDDYAPLRGAASHLMEHLTHAT